MFWPPVIIVREMTAVSYGLAPDSGLKLAAIPQARTFPVELYENCPVFSGNLACTPENATM
jgi:hypothetical protein